MELSSINQKRSHVNASPDQNAVLIPPCAFIMGTDAGPFYGTVLSQSKYAKPDEAPMHVVFLEPYRINRYPVTNGEYEAFVQTTGHPPPPHWKKGIVSPGETNLPVVHVDSYDAGECARWAGGRLPTEAEWEKAARGADDRIYPWRNEFEPSPGEGADKETGEQPKKEVGKHEEEVRAEGRKWLFHVLRSIQCAIRLLSHRLWHRFSPTISAR